MNHDLKRKLYQIEDLAGECEIGDEQERAAKRALLNALATSNVWRQVIAVMRDEGIL